MQKGFTLAEVLVTLGIIGVVSAMTVPGLMKNHQRQVYITQLHKAYNELSQAVEAYTNSKNAVNLKEAGLSSSSGLKEFIDTEFKIVKDCSNSPNGCFASSYSSQTGTVPENLGITGQYCFVTAGGYSMCASEVGGLMIYLDTNAQSGPNVYGRDLFILGVDTKHNYIDDFVIIYLLANGGKSPYEAEAGKAITAAREQAYTDHCSKSSMMGCFGKILNDGWQMTY